MPTVTNTLGRAINIAQINCRNAPLTNIGGVPTEPAFSIGDWVRQFMLAPPFAWRWNRKTATLALIQGQQDYSQPLADFGWLETATINDNAQSNPKITTLEIVLNLTEESVQNKPARICARLDDGSGNIVLRVTPSPDKAYTLNYSYQKAAPIFVALTDTWAPIPDYFSYLYNTGVLAKSYEYMQDARYGETMLMFLRQTIAANEGLSESQVNLFLGRFLNTQRESLAANAKAQLGNQGRGGA